MRTILTACALILTTAPGAGENKMDPISKKYPGYQLVGQDPVSKNGGYDAADKAFGDWA